MKFGIHLKNLGPTVSASSISTLAVRAEELGFDSVWVSDHVTIPAQIESTYPVWPGVFRPEDTQNAWEAFAVLAFVAGLTRRVELGTSVIVLPQRPPLLIAKQWATLDALSGGRTILGIGAGWMRDEFDALGFGEIFAKRGVATDETIRICRAAWTTDGPIEAHGAVYDFSPVLMSPKPARADGLPIWIGGHGSRSIRRAAELGDGWQPMFVTTDELKGHVAHLHEELTRYGRRPEDVTVSARVMALPPGGGSDATAEEWELVGDPDACADKLRRYAAAGVEHFLVDCPRGLSTATMAEVYERVAREIRPRLETAR
jgi:probable F420-dependent oxidoreductase